MDSNVKSGPKKGSNSKLIVYAIALIMFILQLILYLRGLETQWYKSLDTSSSSLDFGSSLWLGAYIFSFVGYGWLLYNYPDVNVEFVITLTVIGITLSVIWDLVFFYAQDILLSVLVQIAGASLYLWLIYVIFKISSIAGLLHIPITIYTYYFFYVNVRLFMSNSEKSSLRPILLRNIFN